MEVEIDEVVFRSFPACKGVTGYIVDVFVTVKAIVLIGFSI